VLASLRRVNRRNAIVISVLLALGAGALTAAVLVSGNSDGDIEVDSNPAVRELLPPRDDTVLPQSNVGAILSAGWSGEILHIGGTVIPLDQQRIQSALNSVIFRPGDGQTLRRLPPGELCATVRYWPTRTPDRTATIDWCFRVDS